MHNAFSHTTQTVQEGKTNEKVLGYFNAEQQEVEKRKDAFLWNAFLSGSKEAFSEIFLKHNPKLVTIGIKLGFAKKAVEDCIQDLFLNLWLKRQNLKEVSSVKYYLVVSLRRALLYQKERETRISKLISGIRLEYPSIELPVLLDDELNKQRIEFLLKSIDVLPQRQAQALKLRYIDQKTYPDIAAIMAVDIDSVRKFVHKAIKNLKSDLHLFK